MGSTRYACSWGANGWAWGRAGSCGGAGLGAEPQPPSANSARTTAARSIQHRPRGTPASSRVRRGPNHGDCMAVDDAIHAFTIKNHHESIQPHETIEHVTSRHQLKVHRLAFLEALEEIPVLNVDVVLSHTPSRDRCA